MVTLQSNVPLPSQEVALLEYKYYRFYVDRPGQAPARQPRLPTPL